MLRLWLYRLNPGENPPLCTKPILFLTLPNFSYGCAGEKIVDLRVFWTDPAFAVLAKDVSRIVNVSAIVTFPKLALSRVISRSL